MTSGTTTYLAVDLGAESGRVFRARLNGGRLSLEEVHRFPNVPVRLPDGLYWDALHLLQEVERGLAAAGGNPASIGVDSWAVDFGLLAGGRLLSSPRHYRDPYTDGTVEEACRRVPKEEIYRTTGIQFLQINTLCQLLALEGSPLMEAAETLLMIPDLMNYWLCGETACEETNASTTQLYDPSKRSWARGLMERLGISERIFPDLVPPATTLGRLLPHVREETGLGEVPVVTVASHDTASAVAAVPAETESFAYVSSGTWSLVGVELPSPVMSEEAMEANFTNEAGFGGRARFLKNVMGLWLLQECRREWARRGKVYSYEELCRLAGEAPPGGALVDPDDPLFLTPGDMTGRIERFCAKSGQKPPEGVGEVCRCIFESLALKQALVIEEAAGITGRDLEVVHVVGGGSQNELLCRMTAETSGLPVVSGPVEATAAGNALVQAYAAGEVESLARMREVVARSFGLRLYEPQEPERWHALKERFVKIANRR